MKRWFGHAAVGLAAYLLALAALVPAELVLARAIPALEAQGVRLAARGVSGSLWAGAADVFAVNGLRLDAVRWRASPWRLLLGQFDLKLGGLLPGGGFETALHAGPRSGTAEGFEATFSADMLSRYIRVPVTPAGSFVIHLERMAWSGDVVTGMQGRLVWRQAGLTAPETLGFGDLIVDFRPKQGGGVIGTLGDSGGPLAVSGELSFDVDGSYRIDARLAARDKAAPELVQALRFLGKPDAEGREHLTFSGRL